MKIEKWINLEIKSNFHTVYESSGKEYCSDRHKRIGHKDYPLPSALADANLPKLCFRKWPWAESRMKGHPPECLNSGKIYFPPEYRFNRKKVEIVRMERYVRTGFFRYHSPAFHFGLC